MSNSIENTSTSRFCPSKLGGGGLPDSQISVQNEAQADSGFILKESVDDISKLFQIVNSKKDINIAYARNTLIAIKKLMYQEPFIEPDGLLTNTDEMVTENNSFTLFPNPAKESFTVIRTFSGNNLELKLYNIVGEIVYSTTFEKTAKEISTKDLQNGIYLVNIYSDNQLIKSIKVSVAK